MFPIILAHGIARFDYLREKIKKELNLPDNPLDDELQYFRNIRTFLNQNGFAEVYNTNVKFAGSLRDRAEELRRKTNEVLTVTGAEKVHIIAHSMGGLDARMMIVDLGMADKVASLTTIGTPHFGTIIADNLIFFGGGFLIKYLHDALKLDLNGFADLTIENCETFNRRARNFEAKNKVFYQTYSSFEKISDIFAPLLLSWMRIQDADGSNDGLVSVRSQRWESSLTADDGTRKPIPQKQFPIPADHLNQCGWWDWEESVNPVFGGSYQSQKTNYESRIKNIYLEIVRNLPE